MDDNNLFDNDDTSQRSNSYYRIVFFCWFIYLFLKCCCERRTRDRGHDSTYPPATATGTTGPPPGGVGSVVYLRGMGGANAEETAKRRRDLVRERLEFRTITEETEMDIEKGEDVETSSSPSPESTHKEKKSSTAIAKGNDTESSNDSTSNNNNDNDNTTTTTTTNNNNSTNSSSRSVRSLFSKMLSRRTNGESNNGVGDDEDPKISAMSTFSIASLMHSMGLSGPDTRGQECCSICLEAYAVGDTVARLKKPEHPGDHDIVCKHWFHEDCILEWLQNHNECPLCRVNMIEN